MTAALPYVANCGIAIINLVKAGWSDYGCQINCLNKSKVLEYLETVEQTLLVNIPIASVCLWFLTTLLQKCVKKSKRE